jgi:hypothetical protein
VSRGLLKLLGLVLAVAAAFALGRYGREPAADRPALSPPVFPPPSAALPAPDSQVGPPSTRPCVGPGSTREEVRAVLGEPDSIVGGWWHYGRSQFHLGSGTVQDYVNGAGLPLC